MFSTVLVCFFPIHIYIHVMTICLPSVSIFGSSLSTCCFSLCRSCCSVCGILRNMSVCTNVAWVVWLCCLIYVGLLGMWCFLWPLILTCMCWLATFLPKPVCLIGCFKMDFHVDEPHVVAVDTMAKRQRLIDLYKKKQLYEDYQSLRIEGDPTTPRVDTAKRNWERSLYLWKTAMKYRMIFSLHSHSWDMMWRQGLLMHNSNLYILGQLIALQACIDQPLVRKTCAQGLPKALLSCLLLFWFMSCVCVSVFALLIFMFEVARSSCWMDSKAGFALHECNCMHAVLSVCSAWCKIVHDVHEAIWAGVFWYISNWSWWCTLSKQHSLELLGPMMMLSMCWPKTMRLFGFLPKKNIKKQLALICFCVCLW